MFSKSIISSMVLGLGFSVGAAADFQSSANLAACYNYVAGDLAYDMDSRIAAVKACNNVEDMDCVGFLVGDHSYDFKSRLSAATKCQVTHSASGVDTVDVVDVACMHWIAGDKSYDEATRLKALSVCKRQEFRVINTDVK